MADSEFKLSTKNKSCVSERLNKLYTDYDIMLKLKMVVHAYNASTQELRGRKITSSKSVLATWTLGVGGRYNPM